MRRALLVMPILSLLWMVWGGEALAAKEKKKAAPEKTEKKAEKEGTKGEERKISHLKVRVGQISSKDYPKLKAYMAVYDQDSNFVAALEEKDFEIFEDGQSLGSPDMKIFGETEAAVATLFVVDTSASMAGPHITLLKKALSQFVEGKGEEDLIAILPFADKAETPVFSKDKEALEGQIKALKATGKRTLLYKAVIEAAKAMRGFDLPNCRQIILISDGKDEGEGFTLDRCLEELDKSAIPVHAIGMSKISKAFLGNLERITMETSGQYFMAQKPADVGTFLAKIKGELKLLYLLEYTSKASVDNEKHVAEVRVEVDEVKARGERRFVTMLPKDPVKGFQLILTRNKEVVVGACLLIVVVAGFLFWRSRKRSAQPPAPLEKPRCPTCGAVLLSDAGCPSCSARKREDKTATPMPSQQQPFGDLSPSQTMSMNQPIQPTPQPLPQASPVAQSQQMPPAKRKTVFQADGGGEAGRIGRLVGIAGSAAGNSYLIRGSLTLGVDPSNHIVLLDSTTSGRHAQVSAQPGGWVAQDLGSTNGTYVNGQRLTNAVLLQEGDVIKVGGSQFRFTTQG